MAAHSFSAYYTVVFYHHCPLWFWPVALVDSIAIYYIFVQMVTISHLLTYCALITTIYFSVPMRYVGHMLAHLNRDIAHKQLNSWEVKTRAKLILMKHTIKLVQMLMVNKKLMSPMLIVALQIHIPLNAYFLFRIIAKPFLNSKMIISLLVFTSQIGIITFSMLSMAHICRACHACHNNIPTLVIRLHSATQINLKLKCLQFFERLHCSKPLYGFTIGSITTVTNATNANVSQQ